MFSARNAIFLGVAILVATLTSGPTPSYAYSRGCDDKKDKDEERREKIAREAAERACDRQEEAAERACRSLRGRARDECEKAAHAAGKACTKAIKEAEKLDDKLGKLSKKCDDDDDDDHHGGGHGGGGHQHRPGCGH